MSHFDYISPLKNSMLSLFIDKKIGSGASRDVYSLLYDKTLVMKVETAARTFNNHTEWLVWEEVKHWPIGDWFAPCVDIDSYGNCLIQKRTKPFDSDKEFKAAVRRTRGGVIPAVLDDIHFGNFGLFNGVVTCHDYGYHHFFEQVARDMSIAAGYIKYDDPEHPEFTALDVTEGGQFALDL